MKATIVNSCGNYKIWGMDETKETDTEVRTIYEPMYLYSVSSKVYKTREKAMKSLVKHGFEYVDTSDKCVRVPFD